MKIGPFLLPVIVSLMPTSASWPEWIKVAKLFFTSRENAKSLTYPPAPQAEIILVAKKITKKWRLRLLGGWLVDFGSDTEERSGAPPDKKKADVKTLEP